MTLSTAARRTKEAASLAPSLGPPQAQRGVVSGASLPGKVGLPGFQPGRESEGRTAEHQTLGRLHLGLAGLGRS